MTIQNNFFKRENECKFCGNSIRSTNPNKKFTCENEKGVCQYSYIIKPKKNLIIFLEKIKPILWILIIIISYKFLKKIYIERNK